MSDKKRDSPITLFKELALVSNLGFSIAIPIAGGAYLGNLLDQKFNTSPRLTLSFLFLGFFIGIILAYKIVRTIIKEIN